MKKTTAQKTQLYFRYKISIIAVTILLSANLFGQDTYITITNKGYGPDQYENIQYQSIEVSQIIDFSKLVRVYINSSSIVLVDESPAAFDKTGETIKKVITTHIENKYGTLTPESIGAAKSDLKLLVRKSVFTDKADFKAFMQMIDNSIWGLQKHYSYEVYGVDYPSLSQEQKDNIKKLVPLNNYLAKDKEF